MPTNPSNENAKPPAKISAVKAVPQVAKPVIRPVMDANPQPRPEKIGGTAVTRGPKPRRIFGLKPRHAIVVGSFLAIVVAPVILVTSYLSFVAVDQYHSRAAFSIRSEHSSAAISGLLGALTQVSSGSASDSDILFDYIRSQEIVEDLEPEIHLSDLYRKAKGDWFFALGEDSTIEDLSDKWNEMVHVSHETTNGILQIQTEAFTPEDAQLVANAILQKSSDLVNKLSDSARNDAIKFAKDEVAETSANLLEVRRKLTDFRRTNRIVDPRSDAEGQLGILNALQAELARALVERDSLMAFAQPNDPRVTSLDIKISSITERIEAERGNLSNTDIGNSVDIFGEYEDLVVQQEFTNAAYTQALAGLSAARAEARRQARYIAIHVQPTLAQTSLYPRRLLLIALAALFSTLAWAISMLVYYNVRDNR